MIDINKKYGIRDYDFGIGDAVIKSSFPENFFLNYNQKVIDIEKKWIFDYNPYVQRDVEPDEVLSFLRNQIEIINQGKRISHASHAAEYCHNFSLPKCFLKRPRLYRYEDLPTIKDQVVVHIKGKTVGFMPEEVRKQISKNYIDYKIIQIGMPDEPLIENAQDARGLSVWDTTKIIASSPIFIGVNSGFHHISKAYPKVRSKLILEISEDRILDFRPMDIKKQFEWFEFGLEFYNCSNYDIGITDSYLKI
jgi:hypothetical protein